MKNHIYHIRLPPLSVTISITHDPYCVMGATPISTLMFPTNKIRFPCDEVMVDATLASFVDFVCFCFFCFFFLFFFCFFLFVCLFVFFWGGVWVGPYYVVVHPQSGSAEIKYALH